METQQDAHAEAMDGLRSEAAVRETAIRKEIESASIEAVKDRLEGLEHAKAAAEANAAAMTRQVESLQQAYQAQVQEQREVWQKAVDDAVNAEKASAFEERLKIQSKFEDLKRAYDQKTAEELGEGAEIDLYEALRAEFEEDRIEVGASGVDRRCVAGRTGTDDGDLRTFREWHGGHPWARLFIWMPGAWQSVS